MARSKVSAGLLVLFLLLSEGFYLLLYTNITSKISTFLVVSLLNSGLYILLWILIRRESIPNTLNTVVMLILFGVVSRGSVVFLEPAASDDIYRYIWDGKVQANGIDPYRYAPVDSALIGLHSEMLPKRMNHPEMKTIYPPFAQWFFWLTYEFVGESTTGFKIPLLLAELATMVLLALLMKEMKLPSKTIALYALCPLPIMQFMVDGHVDAIVFPFLLLFLLLWMKRKEVSALFAYGFSIVSKLLPLIFLPLIVKEERKTRKVLVIVIPLIVVVAAYAPYSIVGGSPFEALSIFSSNWVFNNLLFDLIYGLVRNNQTAHLIAAGLIASWLVYVTFSKKPLVGKMFAALFGFLLLSPTVHPWYVTWLAVLLPFHFRWSGLAFVTLVNLANFVPYRYILTGVWWQPGWLTCIEYLPIFCLILWEATRKIPRD
jgi:hypothetical protein